MPAPAVTVVLPTYQRRDLVREAVRSVLEQTFADFELIVVDDGSSDGTGEAVRGLDPRLVYVRQEHAGVSAARNQGIRLARGAVVAFVDSDNRWLPEHLAVVTRVLDLQQHALLACTSPDYDVSGREAPEDARLVTAFPEILLRNPIGHMTCTAIRRSALERAGGFDESLASAEDADLFVRLSLLGPFALLRRRTAVIRHTRGGLFERGVQSGVQFAAVQRSLETISAGLARASDPRADQVRGSLACVRGLRAAALGDEEGAKAAFTEAATRLPQLSREPGLALHRVMLLPEASQPAARLRTYRLAADAWPDRDALFVASARLRAVALAVRLGRPAEAAALFRTVRPRGGAAVLAKAISHFPAGLRGRIRRLVHAGRESANLGAGVHITDDQGAGGDDG